VSLILPVHLLSIDFIEYYSGDSRTEYLNYISNIRIYNDIRVAN